MPKLYPSPDGSELCFCPTTGGLSDKNARSARRYAPKSNLKSSIEWLVSENTTLYLKLRVTNTRSGLTRSRRSASGRCLLSSDWSTIAAGSSSNDSLPSASRSSARPFKGGVSDASQRSLLPASTRRCGIPPQCCGTDLRCNLYRLRAGNCSQRLPAGLEFLS